MTFTNFTSAVVKTLGVCLSAYIGVWLLFVGGIVDIVHSFGPFHPGLFSFGLLKFLTCDIVALGILWSTFHIADWLKKEEANA